MSQYHCHVQDVKDICNYQDQPSIEDKAIHEEAESPCYVEQKSETPNDFGTVFADIDLYGRAGQTNGAIILTSSIPVEEPATTMVIDDGEIIWTQSIPVEEPATTAVVDTSVIEEPTHPQVIVNCE